MGMAELEKQGETVGKEIVPLAPGQDTGMVELGKQDGTEGKDLVPLAPAPVVIIPELEFKGAPLSQEKMKMLLGLLMASYQSKETPLEKDSLLMEEFLPKVAEARIRVYPLPFNITNLFLVASVMTFVNSPGMVMGMLWLAKRYYDRTGKKLLGVPEWCEMFPWGPPTPEECERWWDAQKMPKELRSSLMMDNMVDYPVLWGCQEKLIGEVTI